MSTYKMTPAERRARAQAIVQARQKWNNYAQYRKSLIAQQEMAQRERAIKEERESEKEANWFVRGLSTIGDIAANVLTGAVKGLEGIYDLGAGIVGAVGGIFDDDFQDDVQKHIAKDYTSEWIGDPLQDLTKHSWTNSWKYGQLVENIASGVGQMLPAVAATTLTAGAGAPAAVSQLASLGTLGASATGNATESAYQDGASYYGGLGYGVASGAVELATEKLFGGATKNIFGKGMLDDVGKSIADTGIKRSIADTGIKRVAKNALEEGLEEAAAEIANPALKAIYKGKTAFSDYKDIGYWKDVGKAGAIGSLTALAYSGTVGYGLAKRGKGYVGAEADINDSLYEIEGQKKKANNLFADDKLSDVNAARITQNLQGNYQNIEKTLKKATPEKRAQLIKKFSLESAFETDGTMKADFASTLDFIKQAEAITENGVNGSENAVASLDRRYINPDLIGQDTKINETLSTVTEDLRKKYMQENNATYEQAVEAIKDVTPFKKEFTDKGKASYSKFKKGLNYLNGVSGHTVNMVVVDEHDRFNGNIVGDTIYIGADTFENDTWAGTLVHEYTHFAEGTKEYAKLVHYLRENQELSAKAIKDVFGKGYGFTVEGIEKLYDKFEKGEKLSESELQTLTVYESELGAHLTENLLGNESFIDRLVGKETKIAEKVLNKIADLKKMFERIGNAEARAEYKQIKKAEKLYLGAVEKAGYAYVGRKIISSRPEEEVDESEEIQYNRKKTPYVQWKSDALAWANSSRTKIGDVDSGSDSRYIYFYEAIDPDNDGRATDYRVVAKVSFANKKLIDEWEAEVEANNERNYAKRSNTIVYESADEYASTRKEYKGDNATFVEQSSRNGRGSEVHQGEPGSDGKRNTQKSDGSSQGVKYSLKIGDETISGSVEETRNLVALHNLTEEKLLRVLNLGGFPMPSIAITKASIGFSDFGNITVVFGKDTIDPQRNAKNKVFSRDAWTPTAPRADVLFDGEKIKSLEKGFNESLEGYGEYLSDVENFFDSFFSYAGEYQMADGDFTSEEVGEKARSKAGIIAAYLKEKGKDIEPVSKVRKEFIMNEGFSPDEILSLARIVGLNADNMRKFANAYNRYSKQESDWYDNTVEALRNKLKGKFVSQDIPSDVATDLVKDVGFQEFIDFTDAYRKVVRNDSKNAYDKAKTLEKLKKNIDDVSDFERWIYDKLSEAVADRGIRNNADIFTPSGNRRKFKALHYPYTIENIVKAMSQGAQTGVSGFFGVGAGSLAGKLARQFKSIKDIKEAESLLKENERQRLERISEQQKITGEFVSVEADENSNEILLRKAEDMLSEIADDMATDKKSFDVGRVAREAVSECAGLRNLSAQSIYDYLKREYGNVSGLGGITMNVADRIRSLFAFMKNIPTDYFEAKPRRAVGLNEIKRVLIPKGASEKLTKALEKKNIEYIEYEGERSRSSIIKSMDDIRFSMKNSKGEALTEEQAKFFADSKARDKNGNLLVVYHGTEGEFYTFDKTYRGAVTGAADAKLGFFFTTSKTVAHDYAVEAYDNKVYNLRHKIAGGDPLILNLLGAVEGYKELAATEDVKEYGRLIEKGERLEHDIYELYLNITNPLEVDFKGKPYKKGAMLRLVTKALTERRDGVIIRNMDDTLDFSGDISDVLVAFEPNQIKLVTNKTPTDLDDIRYSLKSNINEYTEKQYNDFGWARVNGFLTAGGNQYFHGLFNQETRKENPFKTANGEYIIPTYDDLGKKHQTNNILVFAKGEANNPFISKIYKIKFINEKYLNETNLSILEEYIYEQERVGRTEEYLEIIKIVYPEATIIKYAKSDSRTYKEVKAEWRRQSSGNESRRADEDYQRERNGNGNFGENQENVRFSLKADINEYTEKQYNDFGWARVNGVLSMRENADFRSKYGEIKSGKQKQVHRTANGEIIVAVNDMEHDKFGVNNVLVFAKGTYENYKITRVVRLQLDNETSIEQIRDIYYEIETSRTEYPYTALDLIENVFGQEIVSEYAVGDFSSYQEIKAERGRQDRRSESGRADEDYQREQDGSRNFGENQENVKFSLKDNDSNNGVRRRYALKGSDKVMTELPNEKVTMKDFICGKATKAQLATQVKGDMSETSESLKVLMTNAQAALERVLIENGIADATARTNYIRAGKYAAYNAIETQGGQYNLDGGTRVGDSLGKIMQPIYKANEKDGKTYADFELYLLHHHNIDRMAAGKPVFHDNNTPVAEQVTMEDSQAAIAELDKEYPQFRKIAEKIWKFSDNNLQLSVDSGMYTQEHADTLRKMYPHYVPTFREEYATRAAALMGKNNVWVNNAKKAAKGSSARILPIDDMLAAQTIQKTTSARINSLLVEMLERGDHDEFKVIATENAEIQIDDDTQVTTYEDKTKNTHQVTFYHNGKKVTAQVSRLVFKGIEAFRASSDMLDNVTLNAAAKVNSIFKKLVTSLNPFFSFFRNPIRDMQDALLYTRYSFRKYSKNYLRAWREIVHNEKYWQEAKAAGIISASVYDYQKGIKYKQNGIGVRIKRFLGKLESASNAIEMAPRLAEYICAREAGLSVQEALLQAQDVTTNFGRGGTFAKKLNSTIMPFLNPSIQGFSKMWRAYTGKDGAKAWVNLIIRSLILGIGMSALNDLLNDDDEEYEKLSDYVKEQNYLIALGGGDFLKIPKGRVIGVFGNAFLRGRRYANGETDAWEGYFDSVKSSVTPVDNFTRTIFSPITDIKTNTTWYGGAIESQKWNDTEPKNRYDESTSKIAIWLGKVFNYSPLKIDYLLEQYGGIVADLVLPATSTQAESGIISQNMLTNATLNSKCSTKFYSTLEDYTYKKTAGDLQAKGVVRYLTHVNSTVSEMYNQKRTIQADKSLSNSEKLTQTRVIQAAINTLQQESIGNVEYLYEELGKYNLSDDDIFEQAYLDCISVVMGEEYALQIYDKHVCEKATKLNKIGVDYATYYDCYFGLKAIEGEKDDNGETIRGSKKKAVIEYILSQNLSMAQKLVLIMAQGYTITDGDVRGITAQQAKLTVGKYITSTNLTKEEKVELAKMIGFPVKNGKIYFS